jgi:hypothetical protein
MDADQFGAWRRRMKLTQQQLADKFGVTRTTIQNWESGTTGIPSTLDAACEVWEERIHQEDPKFGPVTLVWADGPMFVTPGRPVATMHQQGFATNAEALGRVMKMWGQPDFHTPFIMDRIGKPLWNRVELTRVVDGNDKDAPTPHRWRSRSIAALAEQIRSTAGISVRSGPRMLSPADAAELRRRIEVLASELDELAAQPDVTYEQVEKVLLELRMLGKHPPTELVSDVAQAIASARDECG